MRKNRKEDQKEFDELDELEIQPLTDDDLAAVGAAIGLEGEVCSFESCSCF